MDIKVGSMVKYIKFETRKAQIGKVILICTIDDSFDKELIGKKFCQVSYDESCYPDNLFIEELKLVE